MRFGGARSSCQRQAKSASATVRWYDDASRQSVMVWPTVLPRSGRDACPLVEELGHRRGKLFGLEGFFEKRCVREFDVEPSERAVRVPRYEEDWHVGPIEA